MDLATQSSKKVYPAYNRVMTAKTHYPMNIRFNPGKPAKLMSTHLKWDSYLEKVGAKKDREAFTALFNHFSPLLKSFLMKSGGQDPETVEELVQETWIKVWRKAPHFSRKYGSASTWIYTIARNTRIDAIRTQIRQNPDRLNAEEIYADNHNEAPSSTLVHLRNKRFVSEELRKLPAEQSEVLALMYFSGKSGQQVADTLNLPLGTVKSRIRLALAKMKLALPGSLAERHTGETEHD